jgi:sporulation-control protein spo0M
MEDEIPTGVYAAWWTGLIVVVLLVPVAVHLLHRTLRAALSIQRYLAEMEAAGARIAENTAAVAALEDTEEAAAALLDGAQSIEGHARTLAETLSSRIDKGEQST